MFASSDLLEPNVSLQHQGTICMHKCTSVATNRTSLSPNATESSSHIQLPMKNYGQCHSNANVQLILAPAHIKGVRVAP